MTKTKNKKIGDHGEDLAVKYLVKKGYKILERNVKISYKEIDVIAKISKILVFVEVKTCRLNSLYSADEYMNKQKLHHLKKAIGMYLSRNKYDPNNIRLDLVAVDIDYTNKCANIKHYKELF